MRPFYFVAPALGAFLFRPLLISLYRTGFNFDDFNVSVVAGRIFGGRSRSNFSSTLQHYSWLQFLSIGSALFDASSFSSRFYLALHSRLVRRTTRRYKLSALLVKSRSSLSKFSVLLNFSCIVLCFFAADHLGHSGTHLFRSFVAELLDSLCVIFIRTSLAVLRSDEFLLIKKFLVRFVFAKFDPLKRLFSLNFGSFFIAFRVFCFSLM